MCVCALCFFLFLFTVNFNCCLPLPPSPSPLGVAPFRYGHDTARSYNYFRFALTKKYATCTWIWRVSVWLQIRNDSQKRVLRVVFNYIHSIHTQYYIQIYINRIVYGDRGFFAFIICNFSFVRQGRGAGGSERELTRFNQHVWSPYIILHNTQCGFGLR